MVLAITAALSLGLATVPTAAGAPTSKQDRIAQLESKIALNRVRAEQAALAVDQSASTYALAFDDLTAAEENAQKAATKAAKARAEADAAKTQLGRLAVAMYRQDGNKFGGFEAITQTDAFHTQALKREVTDILGAKADTQIQGLTALQNVADVLERQAQEALVGKREAANRLANTEKEARAQAEAAVRDLRAAQAEREQIIAELARAREVSIAQERKRQEEAEKAREAAAQAAAEQQRARQAAREAEAAAAKRAQEIREAKARAKREKEAARLAREAAEQAARSQANAAARAAAQEAAARAQAQAQSAQQAAQAAENAPAPSGAPSASAPGGLGPSLLEWARGKIGVPYVWGGTGPDGYDCSGLVFAGMKSLGKAIARTAASQYSTLANVPFEERQPGDLVFYSSNGKASGVYHVGIYAGNDQLLHAPMPGYSVTIVQLYNRSKIMPFVARL